LPDAPTSSRIVPRAGGSTPTKIPLIWASGSGLAAPSAPQAGPCGAGATVEGKHRKRLAFSSNKLSLDLAQIPAGSEKPFVTEDGFRSNHPPKNRR
jgi:hypothetical protein